MRRHFPAERKTKWNNFKRNMFAGSHVSRPDKMCTSANICRR